MKIAKCPHSEVFELVQDKLHDRITGQEFVEGLRKLDTIYPDAGYFLAASSMAAHYARSAT